jgi:hypothetical protein
VEATRQLEDDAKLEASHNRCQTGIVCLARLEFFLAHCNMRCHGVVEFTSPPCLHGVDSARRLCGLSFLFGIYPAAEYSARLCDFRDRLLPGVPAHTLLSKRLSAQRAVAVLRAKPFKIEVNFVRCLSVKLKCWIRPYFRPADFANRTQATPPRPSEIWVGMRDSIVAKWKFRPVQPTGGFGLTTT